MKRTMTLLLLAVVLTAVSCMSPIALAAEVCYPTAVEQSEDGGEIRKVYDLSPEQDPAGIPRSDFEQDGVHYTLTDLLKQEMPEYQERQHTEEVSLESKNKDMASILALLPQEKEFVTEDGLSGTLTLQLDTVQVDRPGGGGHPGGDRRQRSRDTGGSGTHGQSQQPEILHQRAAHPLGSLRDQRQQLREAPGHRTDGGLRRHL